MAQIISWGSLIYAFPLLATPMAADFTWSRSAIFGLASLALAVAGLAAYPVGRVIDRGHGRAVMAGGSLLATLALLVWSHVDAGWLLPPLFILIGLAQSMTLYEPGFAVVSQRFGPQARRGITALTLWGGFASTLFVPLTQFLLDRLGWRGTLEVLAAINLFLALPLHLRVIDRAAPMLSIRAGATDEAVIPWVLRQPAFWGLMAAFTLYYALFSGISFHLYPLLGEQGLSTASVVLVLTLIGPAQVVGRVIVAAIAERAPIRQVGVGTILALPVALALLLLPGGGVPALVLFAILYGAANGIMTIIRGAAVPEMLTPRAYGAVNGLMSLPGSVCKALAPLLVALIWDRSGSYQPVLWLGIAACVPILAGFLLAAFTRPPDRSRLSP
ncbi:MFS transporter [Niveispirillum cyanobacteriorum]|uniref:MFS transporter n=2 Tax=Niveispirillum cyanobacteriorum TaxID=1612173 RepID=A0A2K9NIM6_9PROT|nr:MFS transporter [Niveispirillum cyanobacteriorum]